MKNQKLFFIALFSLSLVGSGCGKTEILDVDTAQEKTKSVEQSVTVEPVKESPTTIPKKEKNVEVKVNAGVSVPAPVAPVVVATPVIKTIKVTAQTWAFEPSTITVSKGDKVKLVITSIDVAHGFSLPDFNVKERLEPNKTTTVEFTADKVGSFGFFCSVQCGDGHTGMRGTLEVK